MRSADLSVLGLYEWDNSLFDLMQLPEGLTKDTLVKNLLAETAELEVLYANPIVLKNLIGVWSLKELPVWEHLYQTTQYEYNPIENYNRYEEGTEDSTGNTAHSGADETNNTVTHGGADNKTSTMENSGRDSTTANRSSGGSDTTAGTDKKGHWVAGFDAGTPTATDDGLFKQTRDEDSASSTTTYGKTETGTDTTNYGKKETGNETINYNRNETGNETRNYGQNIDTTHSGRHNLHVHGNIGVMSSQSMIQEERNIALFNMYDIIIESFKERFCIMVY